MSLRDEIVPPVTKALGTLSAWLDKAEAHAKQKSFDANVLLASRLSPDQFPLRRQVQAACDQAKFAAARLAGKDPPKHADGEQSYDELRARIAEVRAFLDSFTDADFAGAESKLVPFPQRDAKTGALATDWLRQWALPNFYFHLVHGYAILRHNGVELGKRDYMGVVPVRPL